jgi:hypothetical protein
LSALSINRAQLGYLEPHQKGLEDAFAQCAHCFLFDRKDRCGIHGPKVEIAAGDSCDYFAPGTWSGARLVALVTPAESGLVHRQVRCENCRRSDGKGHCRLYQLLNKLLPAIFKLDPNIKPKACCNLQAPKG